MTNPSIAELMARPYHVQLVQDSDGADYRGWFASVAELPGCTSKETRPKKQRR